MEVYQFQIFEYLFRILISLEFPLHLMKPLGLHE